MRVKARCWLCDRTCYRRVNLNWKRLYLHSECEKAMKRKKELK